MPKITDSLGKIATSEELAKFYLRGLAQGIGVTASLVSRKGYAIPEEGNSDNLTWVEDRLLLMALRRNSDVILTTGKTARAEKYQSSKLAPLAILSRTKNLLGTKIENSEDVIFINSAKSPADAIAQLMDRGFKEIHVEYGPSSLISCIQAGVIDLLLLSQIGEGEAIPIFGYEEVFSLKIGTGELRGLVNGVAI